jgi:hypothetical protein
LKVSPNTDWYSEYEVTTVGTNGRPLTVGPTSAAPVTTGPLVTNDLSLSLTNTLGDIIFSAIAI